jgi:hypothetical protein
MIDWNKEIRAKTGLRNQNMMLRNQRLAQEVQANMPDTRPASIIGGQLVQPGDTEGYNAANAMRNDAAAEANARMSLRGKFGSRDVTSMRGMANSAAGGSAVELGQTPRGMLPGAPVENDTVMQDWDDPNGLRQNLAMESDIRPKFTMNDVSRLSDGSLPSDRMDRGFRDGGMIDKPRMVKQPGYKCGGKVKMPGYEMGGVIGPEVTKWAGEKKKKKGMRGYAQGGKVGKKSEDTGKDTVDVRVREGEYMLAPETVGFMGGGDYSAGVRMLDEMGRMATGEEPGPVPVNDDGEAMRGFRRGGKMGYATGAMVEPYPDPRTLRFGGLEGTGSTLSRGQRMEMFGRQAGQAVRGTIDNIRNLPIVEKNVTRPGTGGLLLGGAEAARALADKQKNQFYTDPDVPELQKGMQALREIGDTGLRLAGGAAGAALAAPVPIPGARIAGGIGGYMLGDQIIDNDSEALRAYREANPVLPEGAEETASAGRRGDLRDAYYRPFGSTAPIDLANAETASASTAVDPGTMNIVQRTGGPAGEVIVREDIDGVPTFSNLRQLPQGGDAATLQAQADARAMQDMGLRQMQTATVDQMRDAAPIYSQEGLDQRRAEQLAQAEVAASGSGRGKAPASDAVMKSVKERFQRPSYDEDGNLTGSVDDVEAERTFMDAMSQLQHSSGVPMTVALESMSEGERAQVYEDFERVYRDTQAALRAAAQQGLPASDMLRTGAQGLRMEPTGREVVLGDVPGPEATLGDWWAGLGNDDPALNRYVQDPESGAVIPARRLTRNGLDLRALRDYGFVGE